MKRVILLGVLLCLSVLVVADNVSNVTVAENLSIENASINDSIVENASEYLEGSEAENANGPDEDRVSDSYQKNAAYEITENFNWFLWGGVGGAIILILIILLIWFLIRRNKKSVVSPEIPVGEVVNAEDLGNGPGVAPAKVVSVERKPVSKVQPAIQSPLVISQVKTQPAVAAVPAATNPVSAS
jgi:hypothetical protein